jgi:hypothetical protein
MGDRKVRITGYYQGGGEENAPYLRHTHGPCFAVSAKCCRNAGCLSTNNALKSGSSLYVTHWVQKFKDKNDYESLVCVRTGNLLNTLLARTTCSEKTAQQAGESANSYLNVQPLQAVCWAPCSQCGAHLQLRMVLCFNLCLLGHPID